MRVRWTSNKRASDKTSRIRLNGHSDDDPRILVRGQEGELTQEEYDKYSNRFELTVLDEDKNQGEHNDQDQDKFSDEESDDYET